MPRGTFVSRISPICASGLPGIASPVSLTLRLQSPRHRVPDLPGIVPWIHARVLAHRRDTWFCGTRKTSPMRGLNSTQRVPSRLGPREPVCLMPVVIVVDGELIVERIKVHSILRTSFCIPITKRFVHRNSRDHPCEGRSWSFQDQVIQLFQKCSP